MSHRICNGIWLFFFLFQFQFSCMFYTADIVHTINLFLCFFSSFVIHMPFVFIPLNMICLFVLFRFGLLNSGHLFCADVGAADVKYTSVFHNNNSFVSFICKYHQMRVWLVFFFYALFYALTFSLLRWTCNSVGCNDRNYEEKKKREILCDAHGTKLIENHVFIYIWLQMCKQILDSCIPYVNKCGQQIERVSQKKSE